MELSGTRVSGGDRARLVKLAKAARELSLREERSRQGELRGGLIHFVRYFWHVLEPERKLVEGWPLEALCVHLEAISRGELNKSDEAKIKKYIVTGKQIGRAHV